VTLAQVTFVVATALLYDAATVANQRSQPFRSKENSMSMKTIRSGFDATDSRARRSEDSSGQWLREKGRNLELKT